MNTIKDRSVRIRCTDEDRMMLDVIMSRTDRTMSNIIRKLIKDYYNTIKDLK